MKNGRPEELGRYGKVEPETISRASGLISKGRVYDLSLEVNRDMTNGEPCQKDIFPEFNLLTYMAPEKNKGYTDTKGITWGTELIIGGIHNATHIDALNHIQYNGKIIGKYDVKQQSSSFGIRKCGAETIPSILSRGILLDIAGTLGVEKLRDNHKISEKEVKEAVNSSGVELEFGDTVLIRTGKIKDFYNSTYMNEGPGIGIKGALWLYEQGICILGSDYTSIEPIPLDLDNCVHKAMLYERGIHLIENMYLEDLARDKVYKFFFICLPLKITGSTGSWVRPAAVI